MPRMEHGACLGFGRRRAANFALVCQTRECRRVARQVPSLARDREPNCRRSSCPHIESHPVHTRWVRHRVAAEAPSTGAKTPRASRSTASLEADAHALRLCSLCSAIGLRPRGLSAPVGRSHGGASSCRERRSSVRCRRARCASGWCPRGATPISTDPSAAWVTVSPTSVYWWSTKQSAIQVATKRDNFTKAVVTRPGQVVTDLVVSRAEDLFWIETGPDGSGGNSCRILGFEHNGLEAKLLYAPAPAKNATLRHLVYGQNQLRAVSDGNLVSVDLRARRSTAPPSSLASPPTGSPATAPLFSTRT